MKKLFSTIFIMILIACSENNGVYFENLSYLKTLEKAQELTKYVMVDIYSDG